MDSAGRRKGGHCSWLLNSAMRAIVSTVLDWLAPICKRGKGNQLLVGSTSQVK